MTKTEYFFTKYFVRPGNPRYLGGGGNRILVYSQKLLNMGGESCTVLRLRLMRKFAMSHKAQVEI